MWELLLTWLPVFGGILGGTMLLPGIITGVYRSMQAVYGYTNGRLFGDDSSMGIVPEAILLGGMCSISGGLLWLALVQQGKVNEINILYGISLGGILGFVYIGIVRGIMNIKMPAVSTFIGWIVGAIVGSIIGGILGVDDSGIWGGRIGGVGGGILGILSSVNVNIDEKIIGKSGRFVRGIVGGFVGGILGGIIGGLLGGGAIGIWGTWGTTHGHEHTNAPIGSWGGVILGGIVGIIMSIVAQFIIAMSDKIVSFTLTPFFVLLKFNKILCNSCLRYTSPLKSRYKTGIRYCEHCDTEVENTAIPGKVILIFGQFDESQLQKITREERLFFLINPNLEQKKVPIDVSEVYIDVKSSDMTLLERFITYLINYPPQHGIQSVQIFYQGKLDGLGNNLKNALQNNFGCIKQMH